MSSNNGLTIVRKAFHFTEQAIGNYLRVTRQSINRWEKNIRPISQPQQLGLQTLFDIPAKYFKELTDDEVVELIDAIEQRTKKLAHHEAEAYTADKLPLGTIDVSFIKPEWYVREKSPLIKVVSAAREIDGVCYIAISKDDLLSDLNVAELEA